MKLIYFSFIIQNIPDSVIEYECIGIVDNGFESSSTLIIRKIMINIHSN